MSEEAKALLWRQQQRQIAQKRAKTAQGLQAPEGPAQAVRAGFAPLLAAIQENRPGAGGRESLTADTMVMSSEPFSLTVGLPGPQGPPGPSGAAFYEHVQSTPLQVWTVAHNLGHYPDVNVYTAGGVLIETPEVANLSVNVLEIRFSTPFAGTARLN